MFGKIVFMHDLVVVWKPPTCAWVSWTMLVAATRWGWDELVVTRTDDAIGTVGSGEGASGSTVPFSSTIPSIA